MSRFAMLAIAALAAAPVATPAAFAETEIFSFVDDYIEYLGTYVDAATEADVGDLRLTAMGMTSDDKWLDHAAETLSRSAGALEKDPALSASGVEQSVLYVT